MTKNKWRDFEKYVEKNLKRLYPGYKCYCQRLSRTTKKRPDNDCYLEENKK